MSMNWTYKIQGEEILGLLPCKSAKTTNCLSFKKTLENLGDKGKMVVFVGQRNVLQIAERGLYHVSKQEVQELGCITLLS